MIAVQSQTQLSQLHAHNYWPASDHNHCRCTTLDCKVTYQYKHPSVTRDAIQTGNLSFLAYSTLEQGMANELLVQVIVH
jgi:hypothetical protein